MRFIVSGVSPSGGAERLGVLVTRSGARLPTPRAAVLTRAGSVPHVSRELLGHLSPDPFLLLSPLSSCLHLEPGVSALGRGLAAFCGARPEDAWLVTPDDASVETPKGHFRGDEVPLWTRHGKALVSAEKYMNVMEAFRPDAYVALADTRATSGDGRKRLQRAVCRSNELLDACVRRHRRSGYLRGNSALIGVLTGWGCDAALERSVRHAASHADSLAGVMVADCEAAAAAARPPPPGLAEALARCGADKLRLLPGSRSPADVLACVALGCDLFDTSPAARFADGGAALALPLRGATGDFVMQLDDTAYREDFNPLVAGCACFTCGRHTRAYIHHLIRTKELLAPLLLTLHNLHHYAEFFSEIRQHIAAGTFPDYQELITSQHEQYLRDHPAPELSSTGNTVDESGNLEMADCINGGSSAFEEAATKLSSIHRHSCSVDNSVVDRCASVSEGRNDKGVCDESSLRKFEHDRKKIRT